MDVSDGWGDCTEEKLAVGGNEEGRALGGGVQVLPSSSGEPVCPTQTAMPADASHPQVTCPSSADFSLQARCGAAFTGAIAIALWP